MKKNLHIIILAILTILMMSASLMGVIEDTLGMIIAFSLFLVFTIVVFITARKNDIKFVEGIMVIFAIVTILLLGFTVKAYINKHKENTYKFQVIVNKDDTEKTKLFTYDGRDYYTYKLSSVEVIMNENDEKLSLENALINKKVTLDEILSLAVKNKNTTGYEIYYDGGQNKYENDEYSIVVCEKDKKDIIFSTFDYKYDESICK